jgi:hypothetical protein
VINWQNLTNVCAWVLNVIKSKNLAYIISPHFCIEFLSAILRKMFIRKTFRPNGGASWKRTLWTYPTKIYKYWVTNICNLHPHFTFLLLLINTVWYDKFFAIILSHFFRIHTCNIGLIRLTNIWKKLVGIIFHKFVRNFTRMYLWENLTYV